MMLRGALIGLLVGLILAFLLTLGPGLFTSDDGYESIDAVVYLGVPLIVVSGLVGAVVGAAVSAGRRRRSP